MRRPFAFFLLAAFLLLPTLPALAGAPVLTDTTAAKARIDNYVNYMTSTEKFMDVPVNSPGDTFALPKGLFPYVETWVGVFQAERYGSISSSDMSVGAPGSTDYDRGEGVNGFYNYCAKYKDFLLKVQEMSNRIMIGANSPLADAGMQTTYSEIMRAIAAIAQNSMSVTLTGTVKVHGNAVCANAIANIYYSFNNPLSGYTSACIGNVLSDPARDPANSSGTCVPRKRNSLGIATMPDCFSGDACSAKVTTNCSSSGGCVWYDFKSRRAFIDTNLKTYDDALAEQEKKLVEVAGALAKLGADAAKTKAALLARGTALSLPLPLSDITLEGAVGNALNALLGIVGAVALLMFVWGGIQWMTAAGNQEQVGKAKKTITWAALGLIAIFSSYAVLSLIIKTFTS
jgi:hypothetical protein